VPLPSYPVLPAPRTWSPGDKILTRYLRGDVTNAVQLLTGPPLVVAAQLTTGQSLPQNVITQLGLDTDLTDTWAAHQIPSPQISAPLPGWYLCEGYHASNNAVTSSQTTAGLTYTQNGTAYNVGGASTSTEGSNGPAPAVADLVLLNGTVTPYPFTATSAGSLFTAPGSAYSNGTPVVLSSAGATLPGGFAAGVTYWVVSASGPAFQLSAASGGSPQTVTSTGSGTVTATDTVALYGVQTGASTPAITHAYLTMQWAGAPSGTVIASPVAPAPWPPGSGVTLTSPAAAGATSVVVSSAQGMIADGTLGLDVVPPPGVSPPSAEPVTITAITGTTISITPCAYPHSSGAPVTVPVSAAWLNQQVRDQIRLLAFPPMARLTNSGAATQNLASQTFPAGTAVTWNQGPSRPARPRGSTTTAGGPVPARPGTSSRSPASGTSTARCPPSGRRRRTRCAPGCGSPAAPPCGAMSYRGRPAASAAAPRCGGICGSPPGSTPRSWAPRTSAPPCSCTTPPGCSAR